MFTEDLREYRACFCVHGKRQDPKFYIQDDCNHVGKTGSIKEVWKETPENVQQMGLR